MVLSADSHHSPGERRHLWNKLTDFTLWGLKTLKFSQLNPYLLIITVNHMDQIISV